MTGRRPRKRVLAAVLIGLSLAFAPAALSAGGASFLEIQNDMMCVACHEPLAVSQSPEAFSERSFIRLLIAQGLTKAQIEKQMVADYGAAVLAKPPASGFNLLIYVLPPVLLAVGIVTLLVTIPRWRRRSRVAAATESDPDIPLDPIDARRLQEDLSRHA